MQVLDIAYIFCFGRLSFIGISSYLHYEETGGSDITLINLKSLLTLCFIYSLRLTQYLNHIFHSIHEVLLFIQEICLENILYISYEFRYYHGVQFHAPKVHSDLQLIFGTVRQNTNKYTYLVPSTYYLLQQKFTLARNRSWLNQIPLTTSVIED